MILIIDQSQLRPPVAELPLETFTWGDVEQAFYHLGFPARLAYWCRFIGVLSSGGDRIKIMKSSTGWHANTVISYPFFVEHFGQVVFTGPNPADTTTESIVDPDSLRPGELDIGAVL